jgi:hypothetical protein
LQDVVEGLTGSITFLWCRRLQPLLVESHVCTLEADATAKADIRGA